jgi:hypothetical protein
MGKAQPGFVVDLLALPVAPRMFRAAEVTSDRALPEPALALAAGVFKVFIPASRLHIPMPAAVTRASESLAHGSAHEQFRHHRRKEI